MFPANELQYIFRPTYLIGFCFIFLVAYLLRKAKSSKTVMLPTSGNNNSLSWMLDIYEYSNLFQKSILNLVSSISHRYREKGIFHLNIPFFDLVLLFHPDTVQPLLQTTSNIDKAYFYNFFDEGIGSSLLLIGGEKWHKNRKLLTPAFHLKILEKFLPVMEMQSKILVERLSYCGENGSLDILPLVSHCILDILFETAMGLRSRDSHYNYSSYVKHLNISLNVVEQRMSTVWMWPDIIFRLTKNRRKGKKSLYYLYKQINQIIEERILQMMTEDQNNTWTEEQYIKKNQLAFLDILIKTAANDPEFTLENVRNEVLLFLSAGHHTTALTITWSLYLLGKHPDVQKKVQEEVDAVFADDPDRSLNKSDLYNLKYTECVIKEAMRLYPVLPIIARRISKELTIGNYKIPEGFNCIICIQELHKNPDAFPNPDLFNPERFFPENCVGRHPFAYMPFSAGQRNCIGQKFAMMNMKVVLANLMQSLTFESLDEIVETEFKVLLNPKDPIRFKVKTR